MAASAASALAPSGPPACAMSGVPPPPLPPKTSEACAPNRRPRTEPRDRASRRRRCWPCHPRWWRQGQRRQTQAVSCPRPRGSSRSLISMPSTARAISLTSPTTRTPSAPSARAPPPMASFFFASDSSRSSRRRSSKTCARRRGHLLERHFQLRRGRLGQLAQMMRVFARGGAGERLDSCVQLALTASSTPRYGRALRDVIPEISDTKQGGPWEVAHRSTRARRPPPTPTTWTSGSCSPGFARRSARSSRSRA